jgi:alginate O-acetyltransferase complex protein AlgI
MVFSSTFFVFLFLPVVLIGSWLFRRAGKNAFLLAASLAFYAWGEVTWTPLLLTSIVANYGFGLWLGRARRRAAVLAFAITLNLASLAIFKYGNFVVGNLNALLALRAKPPIVVPPIHLPIGISFFTFHAISYLVDVYRARFAPQKSLVDFALYISLFPQLVAGPIVRYHEIAAQLSTHEANLPEFSSGVRRFTIGLGKKVLIANTLALQADALFAIPTSYLTPSLSWLGAVLYALQIYFDFSAYSDMAIGLGHLFGFRLPENFAYPYSARSVTEFWRLWHMSLSRFFRDYVYLPLGGNRHGRLKTYRNLIVVFFLCGLWHGARWTFVVWGMYHGTFLVLERIGLSKLLGRAPRLLSHAYLLFVVTIGWVFFRSDSFAQATGRIAAMFGFRAASDSPFQASQYLRNDTLIALGFAIPGAAPFIPFLAERRRAFAARGSRWAPHVIAASEAAALMATAFVFLISAALLASGTYNPFIYFRF